MTKLGNVLLLCGVCCASVVSGLAMAAAKEKAPSAAKSGGSRVDSAGVRAKSSLGVGVRAGLPMGGIPQAGIDGHYGSDLQLGLLLTSGSEDYTSILQSEAGSLTLHEASAKGNLMMVNGRYFFGNSFYAAFGLGQRAITLAIDVEDKVTKTGRLKQEVEVNSISFLGGVGNIWTFGSGLSLGADWALVTVPISSSTKVTTKASGTIATQSGSIKNLQAEALKVGEDMGKTTMIGLLHVYLGFIF